MLIDSTSSTLSFSGYLTSGILSANVPLSPDISYPEFYPANVPPSPDISHPEFCPAKVPSSPDISHLEFVPANIPLSPDISHPKFCPADIPPSLDISHSKFCPSTFHLIRKSHIQNSVRPTFHFLWIFHIRHLMPDGIGGRFNFPGQTCSDPPMALTRRVSAVDNSKALLSMVTLPHIIFLLMFLFLLFVNLIRLKSRFQNHFPSK